MAVSRWVWPSGWLGGRNVVAAYQSGRGHLTESDSTEPRLGRPEWRMVIGFGCEGRLQTGGGWVKKGVKVGEKRGGKT